MATFNELWNNHPTTKGNDNPCRTDGKPNFGSNQCAIKLGVCFQNSGIDTTKIPGIRHCWQHDKSAGHVLAAEEFAKALKKHSPFLPGIQKVLEVNPKDFNETLAGKRGIIFFKDYWRRTVNGKKESFRKRSGDHIDLWNGHRTTDWTSWARIYIRIGRFGLHSISDKWSDYEDSKSIWFWRVL